MGVSRESIAVKLRNGRLHRLHAGVYAVGHTVLVAEGRWMAGILAGGEGAVLSHRSAAALWCLLDDRDDLIDVTTPRSARSRGIVRGHRAEMAADEVTQRSILPVTTVSRTVFDLAAVVPDSVLERAMREAEVLRLPFRPSLDELISRYPQRSGLRSLRICMQRLGMTHGISRSQLEDRFLRLVERAALPPPKTNVRMSLGQGAGIEVECLWREEGVIVELDGHSAHGTRSAFELDRERDRQLQASGWRVVRIT